jgi:hypothetical protein
VLAEGFEPDVEVHAVGEREQRDRLLLDARDGWNQLGADQSALFVSGVHASLVELSVGLLGARAEPHAADECHVVLHVRTG